MEIIVSLINVINKFFFFLINQFVHNFVPSVSPKGFPLVHSTVQNFSFLRGILESGSTIARFNSSGVFTYFTFSVNLDSRYFLNRNLVLDYVAFTSDYLNFFKYFLLEVDPNAYLALNMVYRNFWYKFDRVPTMFKNLSDEYQILSYLAFPNVLCGLIFNLCHNAHTMSQMELLYYDPLDLLRSYELMFIEERDIFSVSDYVLTHLHKLVEEADECVDTEKESEEILFFINLVVSFGVFFLLIALFIKIGVAPFHAWLPEVYYKTPFPVMFLLITVIKLIFLLVLLYFFCNPFFLYFFLWRNMIFFCIILSLLVGSFGALYQKNIKKFFGYSSIVHSGFILLGLSCFNSLGVLASLLYIFIYIITLVFLFYIISSFNIKASDKEQFNKNSRVVNLNDLRRIRRYYPTVSFILCISFLSLAGLPPFFGFFGKFYILYSFYSSYSSFFFVCNNLVCSFELVTFIVACVSSIISTGYYLRLIKIMYFDKWGTYLYKNMFKLMFKHPKKYFKFLIICMLIFSIFIVFFIFFAHIILYLLNNIVYALFFCNFANIFHIDETVYQTTFFLKESIQQKILCSVLIQRYLDLYSLELYSQIYNQSGLKVTDFYFDLTKKTQFEILRPEEPPIGGYLSLKHLESIQMRIEPGIVLCWTPTGASYIKITRKFYDGLVMYSVYNTFQSLIKPIIASSINLQQFIELIYKVFSLQHLLGDRSNIYYNTANNFESVNIFEHLATPKDHMAPEKRFLEDAMVDAEYQGVWNDEAAKKKKKAKGKLNPVEQSLLNALYISGEAAEDVHKYADSKWTAESSWLDSVLLTIDYQIDGEMADWEEEDIAFDTYLFSDWSCGFDGYFNFSNRNYIWNILSNLKSEVYSYDPYEYKSKYFTYDFFASRGEAKYIVYGTEAQGTVKLTKETFKSEIESPASLMFGAFGNYVYLANMFGSSIEASGLKRYDKGLFLTDYGTEIISDRLFRSVVLTPYLKNYPKEGNTYAVPEELSKFVFETHMCPHFYGFLNEEDRSLKLNKSIRFLFLYLYLVEDQLNLLSNYSLTSFRVLCKNLGLPFNLHTTIGYYLDSLQHDLAYISYYRLKRFVLPYLLHSKYDIYYNSFELDFDNLSVYPYSLQKWIIQYKFFHGFSRKRFGAWLMYGTFFRDIYIITSGFQGAGFFSFMIVYLKFTQAFFNDLSINTIFYSLVTLKFFGIFTSSYFTILVNILYYCVHVGIMILYVFYTIFLNGFFIHNIAFFFNEVIVTFFYFFYNFFEILFMVDNIYKFNMLHDLFFGLFFVVICFILTMVESNLFFFNLDDVTVVEYFNALNKHYLSLFKNLLELSHSLLNPLRLDGSYKIINIMKQPKSHKLSGALSFKLMHDCLETHYKYFYIEDKKNIFLFLFYDSCMGLFRIIKNQSFYLMEYMVDPERFYANKYGLQMGVINSKLYGLNFVYNQSRFNLDCGTHNPIVSDSNFYTFASMFAYGPFYGNFVYFDSLYNLTSLPGARTRNGVSYAINSGNKTNCCLESPLGFQAGFFGNLDSLTNAFEEKLYINRSQDPNPISMQEEVTKRYQWNNMHLDNRHEDYEFDYESNALSLAVQEKYTGYDRTLSNVARVSPYFAQLFIENYSSTSLPSKLPSVTFGFSAIFFFPLEYASDSRLTPLKTDTLNEYSYQLNSMVQNIKKTKKIRPYYNRINIDFFLDFLFDKEDIYYFRKNTNRKILISLHPYIESPAVDSQLSIHSLFSYTLDGASPVLRALLSLNLWFLPNYFITSFYLWDFDMKVFVEHLIGFFLSMLEQASGSIVFLRKLWWWVDYFHFLIISRGYFVNYEQIPYDAHTAAMDQDLVPYYLNKFVRYCILSFVMFYLDVKEFLLTIYWFKPYYDLGKPAPFYSVGSYYFGDNSGFLLHESVAKKKNPKENKKKSDFLVRPLSLYNWPTFASLVDPNSEFYKDVTIIERKRKTDSMKRKSRLLPKNLSQKYGLYCNLLMNYVPYRNVNFESITFVPRNSLLHRAANEEVTIQYMLVPRLGDKLEISIQPLTGVKKKQGSDIFGKESNNKFGLHYKRLLHHFYGVSVLTQELLDQETNRIRRLKSTDSFWIYLIYKLPKHFAKFLGPERVDLGLYHEKALVNMEENKVIINCYKSGHLYLEARIHKIYRPFAIKADVAHQKRKPEVPTGKFKTFQEFSDWLEYWCNRAKGEDPQEKWKKMQKSKEFKHGLPIIPVTPDEIMDNMCRNNGIVPLGVLENNKGYLTKKLLTERIKKKTPLKQNSFGAYREKIGVMYWLQKVLSMFSLVKLVSYGIYFYVYPFIVYRFLYFLSLRLGFLVFAHFFMQFILNFCILFGYENYSTIINLDAFFRLGMLEEVYYFYYNHYITLYEWLFQPPLEDILNFGKLGYKRALFDLFNVINSNVKPNYYNGKPVIYKHMFKAWLFDSYMKDMNRFLMESVWLGKHMYTVTHSTGAWENVFGMDAMYIDDYLGIRREYHRTSTDDDMYYDYRAHFNEGWAKDPVFSQLVMYESEGIVPRRSILYNTGRYTRFYGNPKGLPAVKALMEPCYSFSGSFPFGSIYINFDKILFALMFIGPFIIYNYKTFSFLVLLMYSFLYQNGFLSRHFYLTKMVQVYENWSLFIGLVILLKELIVIMVVLVFRCIYFFLLCVFLAPISYGFQGKGWEMASDPYSWAREPWFRQWFGKYRWGQKYISLSYDYDPGSYVKNVVKEEYWSTKATPFNEEGAYPPGLRSEDLKGLKFSGSENFFLWDRVDFFGKYSEYILTYAFMSDRVHSVSEQTAKQFKMVYLKLFQLICDDAGLELFLFIRYFCKTLNIWLFLKNKIANARKKLRKFFHYSFY